ARSYIARLDPATGLADSFDPNAESYVISIVVQSDGRILAGGYFQQIVGKTRNRIVRLETDGSLDQTLQNLAIDGNGFLLGVTAIAVQPDGKILIGGEFGIVLGVTRGYIARLNPDGTLDTAFDSNANGQVF